MEARPAAERKQRRVFGDEFKLDPVRQITDERHTFNAAALALGVGDPGITMPRAQIK